MNEARFRERCLRHTLWCICQQFDPSGLHRFWCGSCGGVRRSEVAARDMVAMWLRYKYGALPATANWEFVGLVPRKYIPAKEAEAVCAGLLVMFTEQGRIPEWNEVKDL